MPLNGNLIYPALALLIRVLIYLRNFNYFCLSERFKAIRQTEENYL